MYADSEHDRDQRDDHGPDVTGLIDADKDHELAGESRQTREAQARPSAAMQNAPASRGFCHPKPPRRSSERVSSRSST